MTATVFRNVSSLDRQLTAWIDAGDRIAVVPTMGALHAGHLSLVAAARKNADRVIVTIFVNPEQFGPSEDLARYPRDLASDLELLQPLGTDAVFAPENSEMYPQGFGTFVQPAALATRLEGEFRPTHFRGVATIVLKLLCATRADQAWFGQKDFQQVAVIRQMVRDFNLGCTIQVAPTVRDSDGLALSSRNRFLSVEERQNALSLNRTLLSASKMIGQGERDGHVIMTEMNQSLIDGGVTEIDYAIIADPVTLETMHEIRFPAVLLVAARVGTTRLIDNWLVE